jgi:aspartate aminotransferase
MVAQFRARRDAAMAILAAEPSLSVIEPAGAFYLYVRAPGADRDPSVGARFTARLLDAHGVAAVPGEAFGTPGWVRVSYAAALDDVTAGARAMVAVAREGIA